MASKNEQETNTLAKKDIDELTPQIDIPAHIPKSDKDSKTFKVVFKGKEYLVAPEPTVPASKFKPIRMTKEDWDLP